MRHHRTILAVTAVAMLAAGCAAGDHDHDHGGSALKLPPVPNPQHGSPTLPRDVRPGLCFNDPDPLDAAQRRRVFDCADAHRFEVYAVVAADPVPGEFERAQRNVQVCEERLAGIGGIDRADLVVEAFDDAGGTLVCAVAVADFRQTRHRLLPGAG